MKYRQSRRSASVSKIAATAATTPGPSAATLAIAATTAIRASRTHTRVAFASSARCAGAPPEAAGRSTAPPARRCRCAATTSASSASRESPRVGSSRMRWPAWREAVAKLDPRCLDRRSARRSRRQRGPRDGWRRRCQNVNASGARRLVHEAMDQVLVLRDRPGRCRPAVVGTDHRGQRSVGHDVPHPREGVRCDRHVCVHEQDHVARRAPRDCVPPRPAPRHADHTRASRDCALCGPIRRAVVDDDRLVRRRARRHSAARQSANVVPPLATATIETERSLMRHGGGRGPELQRGHGDTCSRSSLSPASARSESAEMVRVAGGRKGRVSICQAGERDTCKPESCGAIGALPVAQLIRSPVAELRLTAGSTRNGSRRSTAWRHRRTRTGNCKAARSRPPSPLAHEALPARASLRAPCPHRRPQLRTPGQRRASRQPVDGKVYTARLRGRRRAVPSRGDSKRAARRHGASPRRCPHGADLSTAVVREATG